MKESLHLHPAASSFFFSLRIGLFPLKSWNPRNPAAVGLYRLQNFKSKPSKRRCTDARAEIRFFKSARADFHPLERFSSVPAVKLSGIIRSEKQLFPPGPNPLGGLANPLGRIYQIFWFCSAFAPEFSSGLGFLKSEVLWFRGRCPSTPPMGAAPWNPASCFGSSTP